MIGVESDRGAYLGLLLRIDVVDTIYSLDLFPVPVFVARGYANQKRERGKAKHATDRLRSWSWKKLGTSNESLERSVSSPLPCLHKRAKSVRTCDARWPSSRNENTCQRARSQVGCRTKTYVSGSILGNGLSRLGAVVLMASVGCSGTQVCKEGDTCEELHVVGDGERVDEESGQQAHSSDAQ